MDEYNYRLDVETVPEFELTANEEESHSLLPQEDMSVTVNTVYDINTGKPVRFWFGTLEEYNALPVIYGDVFYNILEASCYATD